MIFRLALVVITFFVMSPAHAESLVHKVSPHSVAVTIDRLAAAVENAGARVVARVDHAAGATAAGADLRATEMLMFGNPKLGTPALLLSQSAGLDLPLRVVAFEDGAGQVHLVYHDPQSLAETHGLPVDANVLAAMADALERLTNAAIAE